jgi:hypothetical protein
MERLDELLATVKFSPATSRYHPSSRLFELVPYSNVTPIRTMLDLAAFFIAFLIISPRPHLKSARRC